MSETVRNINTHACRGAVFIPAEEVAQVFLDMAETLRDVKEPLTMADFEAALREMNVLFATIVQDYDEEMALRGARHDIAN